MRRLGSIAALVAVLTASLAQPPHPASAASAADAPGVAPTQEETPPPAVPEVSLPDGTINIALLGVDKRPDKSFANTDVIIIASINPDVPSVVMLSIPRDTLAYIPGHWTAKVNTAFSTGGPDLFKQTILYNFGLPIDYYAMVNFKAVVNAVDTLGGVDVVATCPLHHAFPRDPYYMGNTQIVSQDWVDTFTGELWKRGTPVPTTRIDIDKPGVYTLTGLQALAYVRARYGVPGGDVDRGRREQRTVRALFAKAKQIDVLPRIPQLLAQFQENIDTDMPLETILYFASLAGRFNDAIIRSRFLDWGGANGALGSDGLVGLANPADRHAYIQQVINVGINQRPNDGIPIEVWNGTDDPGFGKAAADRLAELGFNITSLQAADHIYDHTVIHDYTTTRKGSAVPLLLRTFDLKAGSVVAEPQPDGPRYRIIVGPDFNTCYYAPTAEAAGNDKIGPADPQQANVPAAPAVIVEVPPTPTLPITPQAVLPSEVQVSAGNVINVRSGPSTSYRSIGRMGAGDTAPVLGRSLDEQWWHIRYAGRLGWISAQYAAPVGLPDPEAAAAAAIELPEAAPLPAAVPTVSVRSGNVVNVRSGPGVAYDVLGQLAGGETADVTGRSVDRTWWQIRFGGTPGWVAARFVRVAGDAAAVPTVQP